MKVCALSGRYRTLAPSLLHSSPLLLSLPSPLSAPSMTFQRSSDSGSLQASTLAILSHASTFFIKSLSLSSNLATWRTQTHGVLLCGPSVSPSSNCSSHRTLIFFPSQKTPYAETLDSNLRCPSLPTPVPIHRGLYSPFLTHRISVCFTF